VLENLTWGLPTMVLCLLLQAILVVYAMRFYVRHEHRIKDDSFWSSLLVLTSVMVILVVGNLSQVAIWAMLFMLLGEFADFHEAFYHSMVNFATLGYGDFVMSDKHKLLGPLEAINGVLMIGVTTAMVLAALQDALKKPIMKMRNE